MAKASKSKQVLDLARKAGILRPRDLAPQRIPRTYLQRLEERDQIRFLLRRQADVEALLVELDRLLQRRRGAVVEVRRAGGGAAQGFSQS